MIPTILVGVFATAWFSLGIQFWFNDRIRTALREGLQASQGYLAEHRDTIKTDALGMKADLERAGRAMFDAAGRLPPGAGGADGPARPRRGGDFRARPTALVWSAPG